MANQWNVNVATFLRYCAVIGGSLDTNLLRNRFEGLPESPFKSANDVVEKLSPCHETLRQIRSSRI